MLYILYFTVLYYEYQIIQIQCCELDITVRRPFKILPYELISFCFSLDLPNNTLTIVREDVQTSKIVNKLNNNSHVGSYISGGGSLYIGQEQDSPNEGFNRYQSIRGNIVDFCLHNELITEKDMMKWVHGEKLHNYSILIDFSNLNHFQMGNVNITYLSRDILRKHDTSFLYLFDDELTFVQAETQCQKMGAKIVLPKSKSENEYLLNFTNKNEYSCKNNSKSEIYNDFMWLGILGNFQNQKWYHYSSNELVNDDFFVKNEYSPVLKERQCISFYGCIRKNNIFTGKWNPVKCESRRKLACHFHSRPLLLLRGLSFDSYFDRMYYINEYDIDVKFYGLTYSVIEKSQNGKEWVLRRYDMPAIKSTLSMKNSFHYPTGRQEWKYFDHYNAENPIIKELFLTACSSTLYSCLDGSCIDLEKRCDNKADCPDGSDEQHCSFVEEGLSYEGQIMPPLQKGETSFIIYFDIVIFAISAVNLNKFTVNVEAQITFEWYDIRLTFKNLRNSTEKNILYNMTNWVPQFNFFGDQFQKTQVTVESERLVAVRRSPPLPDNEDEIQRG